MDDDNRDIHDQEEAEEEALSLCDFPITTLTDDHQTDDDLIISSSSEPSDHFFEFFNHLRTSSEMSHAEDIIFCGKLVPFQHQSISKKPLIPARQLEKLNRRSESMSELNESKPASTTRLMRSSRSLDYQKLTRNLSGNSEINQNSSEIHRNSSLRRKPRWYALLFGNLKFPPEMELRDIKSRQVRRNTATMFPASDGGGRIPVNRKSSWGLLRVLSCKGNASVAVTASFSCMPHV
ncbi:uncharacterized protein LOC130752323 [Actinidia eriantha]|uniref:uncharacterized protein LOC130752323 n=1 Tax=Actinidia eriantha TaxID=165200 RepID=UPI00258C6E83|nr:uncharacterized protein LOC130752323 [Actinidia eriantha]